MALWFIMCAATSLIPFIMITVGLLFNKKAPKKINSFFGYRTELSMKNEETWKFAHTCFGNLMFRSGLITLPVSIAVMLFSIGQQESTIYNFTTIITLVQTLVLIILIIPVEIKLRKNFDKNGNRK